MFGLGVTELLIIAAIIVLLFGARRLPALGSGLGKAIKGFRQSLSEDEPKSLAAGEEAQAEEKQGTP
jgi:sec-independent protein translocase protein TatA